MKSNSLSTCMTSKSDKVCIVTRDGCQEETSCNGVLCSEIIQKMRSRQLVQGTLKGDTPCQLGCNVCQTHPIAGIDKERPSNSTFFYSHTPFPGPTGPGIAKRRKAFSLLQSQDNIQGLDIGF